MFRPNFHLKPQTTLAPNRVPMNQLFRICIFKTHLFECLQESEKLVQVETKKTLFDAPTVLEVEFNLPEKI